YNEFKASHTPLLEAIKQGFGKMNFDFDSTDHRRMRAWMNNIHRFGADKTQAEVYELNEMLKDPEVKSFNDFRNKAKSVFPNYKELYLKTEWDHANATSNMAARYLEMVDDVEIAPYWRLNAIIDDGTTVICRSLDGKVFDKRDPDSWKFLPPLHWKCRTDAEDVFDDYDGEITSFDGAIQIDPDGWERMQKQGFDVNWGDSDQVFTRAQSYLKKLPKDATPINVDDLGITDYGLSEWAKVRKNTYPEKAVTIKSHIDKTGMARVITAENLPVWIDAMTVQSDDMLFTQIRETLIRPDEVYWSDSTAVPQTVFLRFYTDGALKVTTESVRVTAYEWISDPDTARRGLLVGQK
ncbi:phage minor head protein, partial [Chryseobacterium gambrini]